MNDPSHDEPSEAREHLEQNADRVRSRLLGNLEELKARGRRVKGRMQNVELTIRKHPGIWVGAGAAALVALGVWLYARQGRRRREQRRDAILGFASKVLGPAYVVEPAAGPPSALKQSLKKASGALVAAAGRELGRRALEAVKMRAMEPEQEQTEGRAPA